MNTLSCSSACLMRALVTAGVLLTCAHSTAAQMPNRADCSTISTDGTDYVTRVVPVPKTGSPEAQRRLARVVADTSGQPAALQQAR